MDSVFDKSSVYHGIDPMENYPDAYPGWSAPHQRDMGESDYRIILDAARRWLGEPVLSPDTPGYEKDTRCRAALDYALKSSGYDRHVPARLYDKLLARLAGVPEPGLGNTLLNLDVTGSEPGFKERKSMTVKLSADQKRAADETLSRLDKAAEAIQANYEAWGLDFDKAREIVNHLDRQADVIEASVYGEESLQSRQVEILKEAKVFQQDADEPYMSAFETSTVFQQDADEPYMSAYADDDSSAVGTGADSSGRRLAPKY